MLSSVARIFQQRKYLRMKTNLQKIGGFYQKFCLLDSAKEEFICYNNSYRNSFRFLQECFWNSFAIVCSFDKIPTGNTKERAIFALYSISLHFFIFRETYCSGILREFQSELCILVCAQIYQVDTFKMIVPFLNST